MVRILSLLLLAAACTAAALTVDPALSEGRVTGELLPGWRENSGWAKAWVHYTGLRTVTASSISGCRRISKPEPGGSAFGPGCRGGHG